MAALTEGVPIASKWHWPLQGCLGEPRVQYGIKMGLAGLLSFRLTRAGYSFLPTIPRLSAARAGGVMAEAAEPSQWEQKCPLEYQRTDVARHKIDLQRRGYDTTWMQASLDWRCGRRNRRMLVTLGTPFRGSLNALDSIANGLSNALGLVISAHSYARALRPTN